MKTENLVKFINRKTILISNIKDFYLQHDEIIKLATEAEHIFNLTFLDEYNKSNPDLIRISLTNSGMSYFFSIIDQECKQLKMQ